MVAVSKLDKQPCSHGCMVALMENLIACNITGLEMALRIGHREKSDMGSCTRICSFHQVRGIN